MNELRVNRIRRERRLREQSDQGKIQDAELADRVPPPYIGGLRLVIDSRNMKPALGMTKATRVVKLDA